MFLLYDKLNCFREVGTMIIQKNFKEVLGQELKKEGIEPALYPSLHSVYMQSYAFFRFSDIIPESLVLQNMSSDNMGIMFYWNSRSSSARCPYCQTLSTFKCKDYKSNTIQDIPQDNKAVFHEVRFQMYFCHNEDCTVGKFKEQFEGFCDKNYACTNRFKAYSVKRGLACSAHRAAKELQEEGAIISDDTILNYIKTYSAKHLADSMGDEKVKVIGIDDINMRKGDRSTGCTVFVDLATRKILIIVLGTSTEAAKRVLDKYPRTEICCNDRASAYISAGLECGKAVVADRFHLIQNAQQAVKDALAEAMPATIYIRSGAGWINPAGDSQERAGYSVSEKTIEDRIRLSGITPAKAKKYKQTLKILELADMGLTTAAIAEKLALKQNELWVLRRNAADLIDGVEKRIEARLEKIENMGEDVLRGPGERAVKTVNGPKVKSSSDSIVNPYRETVLELWEKGYTHRTMHPILVEQGYVGSQNAIYQFILKVNKEEPGLLRRVKGSREQKVPSDFDAQKAKERPELTLEKISRSRVYKTILKESKEIKEDLKKGTGDAAEILSEVSKENSSDPVKAEDRSRANSKLDDELKEVIFGMADPKVEKDKAKEKIEIIKKKQ